MISYILPLAVPGWGSIALIALAIIFMFGGKKIPELMKGIGGILIQESLHQKKIPK